MIHMSDRVDPFATAADVRSEQARHAVRAIGVDVCLVHAGCLLAELDCTVLTGQTVDALPPGVAVCGK